MTTMELAMRQLGGHGSPERLFVMTYNVLAQCYVRPSYFPYCAPAALRWKNRSQKLAEVFQKLPVRPDVICLQEVDNFAEFWKKAMEDIGYTGLYLQKTGRKREGIAIFWAKSKIELVDHHVIELDQAVGDESDCSDDLLARTQRGSVGLVTEFTSSQGDKKLEFVVATTHLFWDPEQEDVKLLQTQRMLRQLDVLMSKRDVPLIFAGDFNSLPDSAVYRFITSNNAFQSAYSAYSPGQTPAGEPEFTNVNGLRNDESNQQVPNFIGTLDYIFYKSPSLEPVSLLEIMSRAEATKERSLPSLFSPSDHLPLIWSAFASAREKAAFEKIVGELQVPREDSAYMTLFSCPKPFTQLTQKEVEHLNHEYGVTLAQNSLQSGNFRVLVRYLIHSLPLCCRLEKMTPEELESHVPSPTPGFGGSSETSPNDDKRKLATNQIHQAVNALFLVRNFTMRFVEKQDECSLLAHFNQVNLPDFNAVISPKNRGNAAVRVADSSYSSRSNGTGPPPLMRQTSAMNDDLAFRFLETLLTVLVDYTPTMKTHGLHVEVLNTLLVLLAPVAFPRDHSKDASDLSAHNPFLHMLMTSAVPGGKKSFWASGIVHRLLQNYITPMQAPAQSKDALTTAVSVKNSELLSLIRISENVDSIAAEDAEQFSYLTLEGIGSLASTIFRFPLSFYQYFVASDAYGHPIADRSALLFLVLMQSCRDSGSLSNPFREILCSITNAESDDNTASTEDIRGIKQDDYRSKSMEISFSRLFTAIGRRAPYETSHLIFYTMLYSNSMMHDAAITQCDVEHVMLPLLETLYHAKSVDPNRIYMLVIVLLTFTQDSSFVRDAHTKMMINKVPWYSERYILDVSLGSLMMVIFTRLIYRNITHFQDSFIHLNAFAALSNLARHAENIHMYAAQSIVGLIELLAKLETKFSAKMTRDPQLVTEELIQKRNAYVEFIRLLLGVTSSCLKSNLLPRNPQLIYSVIYRADTFAALQQHPDFVSQNNSSIWNALTKFQAVIEAKTTPDDTLDVQAVLDLIKAECVSMLASTASATSRHTRGNNVEAEDASYRYEEEMDPEQFFIPYIWRLIYEQTPEFCWKSDKITLFTPSRNVISE
ncbi:hypothetical protein Poli38472_009204 [Pythium oligandrum]|uniref:Dymeclin n=1 Tax=Pythium oligandrum TaxID=41045 RepID=A0A8K1CMF7_PYTOL|nr:hypothetical protein Poli38472_009204 [Pythium oligandrum]|eukprot:TMW65037.1 hypothetical protein Poli38472_009204 [Pythium oligandrum]